VWAIYGCGWLAVKVYMRSVPDAFLLQNYFSSGGSGYIDNNDATSGCRFCQYANGDQYLATINIKWSTRWRDFGILCAFIVLNFALVFVLTWVFRIRSNPFKAIKAIKGAKKGDSKATADGFDEKQGNKEREENPEDSGPVSRGKDAKSG
jgi:hypothetical protein